MQFQVMLLAALLFFAATAQAAPVYKWEQNGQVHFSSKPPSVNAKPAELPEIMRGEVKLTKDNFTSCSSHGGINCQAGADSDGSVICYDGFKNATTRFKFSCNSPKLSIAEISERNANGGFTVTVRNTNSVKAEKPNVIYKITDGAKPIKLDGPLEIDPFGLADYVYKPFANEGSQPKATLAQIDLACGNCP